MPGIEYTGRYENPEYDGFYHEVVEHTTLEIEYDNGPMALRDLERFVYWLNRYLKELKEDE